MTARRKAIFPGNQGRSSTEIVGGPRSWKNVGHHGWPTERILGFEQAKTAQMAFRLLCFFRNIFKYVHDFSRLSKQFLQAFFFLQRFFRKNSEIFLFKMKTFRPCINLYINSFSASTNTVALIQLLHVLYISYGIQYIKIT